MVDGAADACPVCRGREWQRIVSSEELDEECRLRERFVDARLARPASAQERKDLTDFFHQANADLFGCQSCRLLVRKERDGNPGHHTKRQKSYANASS